jgi:chromosome segregation ATPase
MNFMSVNLPYPTSSLVDVLSILEVASEPAKLKKIIKELQLASVEFSDAKLAYEAKFQEVEKKSASLDEKEAKILAMELKLKVTKESSIVEASELKKLSSETLAKKAEIEALEKSFESKKNEQFAIIEAKENSLALKFAEAENSKVGASALVKEYQEKLAKLKAVML